MSKHPHIALLSLPGNFHCRKWAKALAKAGARVTVISFERAARSPHFEQIQLRAPLSVGGHYRYPSYLLSAKTLRQTLIEEQVDVVYAMGITPFGTWARRSGFRPLTVAALGADVFDYLPEHARGASWNRTTKGGLLEHIRKWYFHRAVHKTLAAADLVTADNRVLEHALHTHFDVPATITARIRWGIDTELVPDDAQRKTTLNKLGLTDRPLVLSPRGLLPVYRPEVVLDSFATLAPQYPDMQFVVLSAGYRSSPQALQHARQLTNRHPNVSFIAQRIDQADSYALMASAQIMVSLPRYDGFSAAVNEAMYFGALPVVSNTPAAQELLAEGAKLSVLKAASAAALSETLIRLLEQPKAAHQDTRQTNTEWVTQAALLSRSAHQYLSAVDALSKNR